MARKPNHISVFFLVDSPYLLVLNPPRACHCEEPVRATPVLSEVPGFAKRPRSQAERGSGAKPKDLNLRARMEEIAPLRSQ